MKGILIGAMLGASLAFGGVGAAVALEIGKPAPDFTLVDTNGGKVSLRQFRGQKVLIEFMGSAFAPTCSANVKTRGTDYQKFQDLKVQILGISVDSPFTLKAFADSVKTAFPLLSDMGLQTIRRYGVLAPDKVRALRAYFLVDEKGILRKQWLLGLPGDDIVFSSDPIIAAIQEISASLTAARRKVTATRRRPRRARCRPPSGSTEGSRRPSSGGGRARRWPRSSS